MSTRTRKHWRSVTDSYGPSLGIEIVATYDTAGSAKMIREGELRETAAIASERAAQVFGLTVLRSGIQDVVDNITRFLIVSREAIPLGAPDKTTVVFTLANEPGALFKALSVFALRGIDLAKLESRPIPGRPFEYLFYVDLAADRQEFALRPRTHASRRVCPAVTDARVVPTVEGAGGGRGEGRTWVGALSVPRAMSRNGPSRLPSFALRVSG